MWGWPWIQPCLQRTAQAAGWLLFQNLPSLKFLLQAAAAMAKVTDLSLPLTGSPALQFCLSSSKNNLAIVKHFWVSHCWAHRSSSDIKDFQATHQTNRYSLCYQPVLTPFWSFPSWKALYWGIALCGGSCDHVLPWRWKVRQVQVLRIDVTI